jgi:murein DD-endopeptidase MepM/ murein hydrolase activator NlpD
MRTTLLRWAGPALLAALAMGGAVMAQGPSATTQPATGVAPLPVSVRTVELDLGQEQVVELSDGSKARVKLLALEEKRDRLRNAVRQAQVKVEVNGAVATLTSATYNLPVAVGGVQIDCPVTRGYTANSGKQNVWALTKAARLRLWPAGVPWIDTDTFVYPVKQRWFASDTQMANEPVFVDAGEVLGTPAIYYHYGLDFGGAEALVEVVSATDGRVVSSAGTTLPAHADALVQGRYDVIYIVDGRGWHLRYSHLHTIEVKAGQRVRMGQRLGLLGKEGGSGGWSHLHFDITSRQPNGQWGIQDGYAYVWQAYQRQSVPRVIAVARPHHFVAVGEKVVLDGGKSWSAAGSIARWDWTFTDGGTATGATVERTYSRPGTYSEVLKATDGNGESAYDFAVVQVVDPADLKRLPPTIHAVYYPTTGVRAGDAVTFKVRSFRTWAGSEEVWDFGDGSPSVKVKSDGNTNQHAKDGYAVTEHRYEKPGRYLARVERVNERGDKAVGRVLVEVK